MMMQAGLVNLLRQREEALLGPDAEEAADGAGLDLAAIGAAASAGGGGGGEFAWPSQC
jgi:hypothetical protein